MYQHQTNKINSDKTENVTNFENLTSIIKMCTVQEPEDTGYGNPEDEQESKVWL